MRFQRIEENLRKYFQSIVELKIEDESHNHRGREGQESHFKIFLVSHDFSGQTRRQRHSGVNNLLADEFEKGLHALSLKLLTPEEFKKQTGDFESPICQGGE